MAMRIIHVFLFMFLIFVINANSLQIKTEQGVVQGKTGTTINNRTFYSFTGIPYARPPVGELRFEPPQANSQWNGIYNATDTHAICLQFKDGSTTEVVGDENCLFLNIYTPQVPNANKNELIPVMFFIHGGGFVEKYGIPEFVGPKILMDKNVVLVTFNYRLGPFGFYSTGDAVIPGNAGLKDQAFALKWVKKNILNFGGDPNKITVVGHSAGAGAAHLHLFSPLTRDLIHGVISQSGAAFNRWSYMTLENLSDICKELASIVGCSQESNEDMVKCLKTIQGEDMIKAVNSLRTQKPQHPYLFLPTIEPDNKNAFLIETPLVTMMSGKAANVPFIVGVTSEEGSIGAAKLFANELTIKYLNNHIDDILPRIFFYTDVSEAIKVEMNKAIKKFYLNNDPIDFSKIDQFIKMCGDATFLEGAHKSTKIHTKYSKQPVFYYLFSYRGLQSYAKYYDVNHEFGVTHADELLYLFNDDISFSDYVPTGSDKKISQLLTTLWTNFAYYDHPTPPEDNSVSVYWKPVEENKENYYHFKRDATVASEEGLLTERAKFWTELHDSVKTKLEL